MTQTRWTRVLDAADLTVERPRTLKIDGKQIVVFRLDADQIHAIDNRCPHEGYPLSTGAVRDGMLTCEWHNWKFRLCDGVCVLGGEDVRHYPLRVEEGQIWLDLADPPAGDAAGRLYAALATAFRESDWSQASRTIERLLVAGEAPADILAAGVDAATRIVPYGFDHGLAVSADLAAVMDEVEGGPGVALLQAHNLMLEPRARWPERSVAAPEPVTFREDAAQDLERELRRRIEAEDLAGAEALLSGALAAGAGREHVMAWLTHAATDHFLGFGHGHIYCVKAEELLDAIGWQHAPRVLTCLVASIVYQTREDRLPYMREYQRLAAPYLEALPRWASARPDARLAPDDIVQAVVHGELAEALGAVAAALERGAAPDRVALALGVAAAHRLLFFDARHEHDDTVSEDWLHVTHCLTHADAVRETLRRRPSADALRGLIHSARFIQHLAVCDVPPEQRPTIAVTAPDPGAPDLGLAHALRTRDAGGAMAAARLGLAGGAPVREVLIEAMLDDRAVLPIFVAHHIKVPMAGLRLARAAMSDPELGARPDADLPLVAAARFLAHPLRERRITRDAHIARTFVREGRMHHKLLGY